MASSRILSDALLAKITEQIERTVHLVSLIPETAEFSLLLGHLLECQAGVCAVLYAAHRDQLEHFDQLRELPVNHACTATEFFERSALYRSRIEEGFALLTDSELAIAIPTVFVKDGESVLTLLLGNLEHLINHKRELFGHLKQMGVPVATRDLYHFRS